MDWNQTDMVLLSHVHKYTDWGARSAGSGLRMVRPVTAYCSNGYLISQEGAAKLLAALRPVFQPADCWNYLQGKKVLRIHAIVPYIVNHSRLAEDSLIGKDLRTQTADAFAHSTRRFLKKAIYDKFIYQLLVKPLLRIRKQGEPW